MINNGIFIHLFDEKQLTARYLLYMRLGVIMWAIRDYYEVGNIERVIGEITIKTLSYIPDR
jgi:hypothetical protein